MSEPNKEVIRQWVDALRSGKYKQGRSKLKVGDMFCCLGVLCDLHSKKHLRNKWEHNLLREHSFYGGNSELLPDEVIEWAGLPNKNPNITINGETDCLTTFNDEGTHFTTIANAIEREFLGGASNE